MSPAHDPLDDDLTPLPFEVESPNSPEGRQLRLELTVNATWKAVRKLNHRIDQVLPLLITREECNRNHPGLERILKYVLLIVAVAGAGWSALKFVAATEHNEALAAEFRNVVNARAESKSAPPIPIPAFTPGLHVDAAHAPAPLEPQPTGKPKRIRNLR